MSALQMQCPEFKPQATKNNQKKKKKKAPVGQICNANYLGS
jgi:hypothetical protein